MSTPTLERPARRRFMQQSAALTVAFSLISIERVAAQAPATPPLPGSLNGNRRLNAWLRIDADGTVTVFTLALQPDSVSGCIMADPSMTKPITLTVKNDQAVLLTSGGIHDELTRVGPNVYAGGYWIKIKADLSVKPKRLTVRNDDDSCIWAATAD
jgi:hypothetical protein